MIRCGSGYNLIIAVSPADATPETPGAMFYRYATWKIGNHEPFVFNEIGKDLAIGYLSGHADGLGFEIPPETTFGSLKEIQKFIADFQVIEVSTDVQLKFRTIAAQFYLPTLPYHNYNHAVRVYMAASDIILRCINERVPVNGMAVYFAALSHDWGYPLNHQALGFATKEALSADWLGRVLHTLGVNDEIIMLSQGAVYGTAKDAAILTNEAKVLRAADLVDLARDLPTFVRNNELLKQEWELLNGRTISWADWKKQTKKLVEFYLSQDIRLTSYHDDTQGRSRFHVKAQQILDEYLVLSDSEFK